MLLSTGKTNAATQINSAVGQGESKVLQANLGNNLASATTFVAGNANTVLDTIGTGDWKFYVSGNTSAAAITSSSASSEWTGGSLLSYTDAEYYMFYPFNTNTVSGTTLMNNATNAYDATLVGGASIANEFPSPATQPAATGTGYLEMNVGAGQYVEINQPVSLNPSGIILAFWFRFAGASECPIVSFDDGTNYFIVYKWGSTWVNVAWKTPSGTRSGNFFSRNQNDATWYHIVFKSSTGSLYLNGIYNTTLSFGQPVTIFQPTKFYFGNSSATESFKIDSRDFATKSGTVRIDNFILYNKTLTDIEIGALYAQSDIYYTFDSDSISSGINVGSKATGTYVYNATLVNGASIGTTNLSPAPTSGTGHLLLTSTNTIATNQYVQLTIQPSFAYTKNWFSVSFWARSNSTLGSSAKITFFDFANSIAASENANYSFSLYLQSNNIRGKISYGTSGTATDDILMYTDSNILTDNVWRHYVWTIDNPTSWKLYINSVLVFTKSSGFNLGTPLDYVSPSSINYNNCFIGRDAGSWQTASFSGAIDEFRFYSSRTIGQGEVSNLYATQVSVVGKFQNPSGGSPTWISKPGIAVDSTETLYTIKSNEIALAPGANSTYAVWTAPKPTNIRIDVSFADYHSRSAGVGFQMFKINNDNTFGGVIFPRTVTSTALTNSSGSYLTVPSRIISVATGDKVVYRIDANGNTTAASSVLATNIYVDPNQDLKQFKYLQAHLGNNLSAVSFVAGNANVVNDTRGTGNWNFYVAGNTSIASISSASASSEWTVGNLLSYIAPINPDIHYTFDTNSVSGTSIGNKASGTYVYDATLVNGASIGTTNPSSALGTGHLQVTSANSIPSNQYVQLTFQPSFISQKNSFSVSFWARSNNTTNGARCDVFNFSKPVAGGTGGNFGHSIHIEGNNLNGLIFHNANGTSFTERTLYTSPSLVSDNTWRHYVWTVQGDQGQTVEWKFYVNSVLVFTQTGGFTGGAPNGDTLTSCFIGRGAATWHGHSFTGAIDEFKWYGSRVIGQSEVSDLYTSQVSVGKFQNPSGGNPTWIATPGTVVNASETNYTVKSNEVALTPGTNSTYAVWTATKSTNIKVDVSFADYHSRSAGVGFQMFKIKSDNTFDSIIFPRTVTTTALTNANSSNYLSVPSITTTVNVGDKLYYRVDANGNTIAASSVFATSIYTDDVSVASNPVENRLLQAQLATNMNSTTFVGGNANTVLDTIGTSDWKFYVASSTSVASISSASASSEWSSGSLLGAQYAFDGTLMNGATIVVDAGSRYSGNPYLKLNNPTYNTSPYQYVKFIPVSIPSGGISFSMWVKHTSLPANTYPFYFSIRGNGRHLEMGLFNPTPEWYVTTITGQVIKVDGTVSTITNGNWHHLVWTISASGMFNMYLDNSLRKTQQSTYPDTGLRTFYNIGSYNDTGDPNYLINGGVDNFKIFTRELTALEVTAEYNNTASSMPFMLMTDSGAAPKWTIKPATLVDATETSYTVKSNEIALAPGTNSTYAVWTAPKTTNLKIDVSFADYHSRSVGVGFQMFKINNDNTFGGVIFPRTVTSTALTNSSGSYLSVPSITISVATGDKIYYRVDANGNTTAASSVLATNIYVDPNQDLKQYKYLQAHLGNNIASTSFVAGNANVVNDTRGTGNWNFYVAGNTSIASISSASASSEWITGNLLSYFPIITPVLTNYLLFYSFSSDKVSGTTVYDTVTNYAGTLFGGATIAVDANSRVSGEGYLKLNSASLQYMSIPSFTPATGGISFSFWFYLNSNPEWGRMFDFSSGTSIDNIFCATHNGYVKCGLHGTAGGNIVPVVFVMPSNNVWCHLVWTIASNGTWIVYLNGTSVYNVVNYYPPAGTRSSYCYFGNSMYAEYYRGGIDNFRYYNYVLSPSNVTSIYNSGDNDPSSIERLKNTATGVIWMPTPGTPVDSSETNYTVKSNEIALTPGTNSTYAVWTATKSTNLKIDVSFADYNSRSTGVGFQMFKIKSDNTFDSVLFPRTVTTTALTNANSSNYLSVPTITTTVNVGDKLYYRIDANGNTVAASSVLATTIYTDDVSVAINPVETRVLQANLASNLNATTLVAGNSNVVYDTVGNSNWQFYVAGGNSIASISLASASSEWTAGNLLSYIPPSQPAPTNYNVYYPINVADINPSNSLQVGEYSTGSYLYNGTLTNGATISTDSGARVAGQGYLKITNISQSLTFSSFTTESNGISFSLWARVTIKHEYIKFFDVGREGSVTLVQLQGDTLMAIINNNNVSGIYTGGPITDGVWKHYVFVMTPASSGTWKTYLNGEINTTLTNVGYPTARTRTTNYIFNHNQGTGNIIIDVGVDDFQFFNRELSASEVYNIYASGQPPKLTNATTGTTWVTTPAVPVNSSETSYTVKSNEIALAPGTNSTYAVWTAPKSTNIRIDVSFADYHSRSAGVGFQMFKINSDNTFGSVIFPRTVTSTALTNANSTNYLSVPSRSLSVSTGDKIYYRIDANGNTNAASSVLATNIYTYSGKWS